MQRRWKDAFESGSKLCVSLVLNSKRTTTAQLEEFRGLVHEREREGKLTDARSFDDFTTTNERAQAVKMSFAQVAQLAFALEHLATISAPSPVVFARSTPWDFCKSLRGSTHAHKILAEAMWPDNFVAENDFWTRMAGWMPAQLVNFVFRHSLDHDHARNMDFRLDLIWTRARMATHKVCPRGLRPWIPFAAPAAVQRMVRTVKFFFELEYSQHAPRKLDAAAQT